MERGVCNRKVEGKSGCVASEALVCRGGVGGAAAGVLACEKT